MHGVVADPVREALEVLGPAAECDVPLGPMTTYRVGGRAAVLVRATGLADLLRVAEAHRRSGLPVLAVGRGSNMLIADTGFRGIAVSLLELPETFEVGPADHRGSAVVTVSAGLSLPVVARRTAKAGLTGFEWAVGVPGSIGGAVRMNAGGHGSDMAASLVDVTIVDMAAAEERVVPVGELGLGFRSSDVAPTWLVVQARLRLDVGDPDASARELAEIVAWRRAHQPGGQNAGSVFVNPVPGEVSAGQLIDAAGLRGLRVGSAHVSEKHANFIQAAEDGTASDVRALMRLVRDRVEAHSGWSLRSEIRLIGFDDGETA